MTEHSAKHLVVGGGIIGCSIAYHLARAGEPDVVLLEKSSLTDGATWHAAGLVGQLRSSRNTTRMLQKSVALYDRLESETGMACDWKKVGSLRLAASRDRMLEARRLVTMARSFGLEMHVVTPSEAQELFPAIDTKGLEGAAFIPVRRPRGSGQPVPVHRGRGPSVRRPVAAGGDGSRLRGCARSDHQGPDLRWRVRGRHRHARGRHVEPGARTEARRADSGVRGRASVRRYRADPRISRRPADTQGSRSARLLQAGSRRSPAVRRLRGQHGSVRRRRDSGRLRQAALARRPRSIRASGSLRRRGDAGRQRGGDSPGDQRTDSVLRRR